MRPVDRAASASPPPAEKAAAIVDDAVIGCTVDGRINHWSTGAEALFGLSNAEAAGRMIDLLAPAEQSDILHGLLRDMVPGGPARRTEAVLRHRDGTALTVMLGAAPVSGPNGAMVGVSLFVRDISEQRGMAAELEAARARLTVMQKQMSQMARLGTLERITLDLAHELNQPLAAIGNYLCASRRLISGKSDPDLDRLAVALDAAMKQSLHAGQIVNGVRAFVLRGDTERHVEPVAALLNEAVALATPAIEEHGARVSFDLDPVAVAVLVDRVQILQVLVNLLRNAVEATQDSSRRELSVASRWADGAVEFSVTDSGKGLPEALRDHVFEPFLTTRSGGTGLGLTICQLIVEAHGGRLSCRSAPGGGSVFCFSVTGLQELPA